MNASLSNGGFKCNWRSVGVTHSESTSTANSGIISVFSRSTGSTETRHVTAVVQDE